MSGPWLNLAHIISGHFIIVSIIMIYGIVYFRDDLKTAMQKMTVGKRDLLLQDPNSAVEHLSEACEMLGKLYGETAPETGDAYFYYGKALLELGRLEAGVIDNVLDGGKHASTFHFQKVLE